MNSSKSELHRKTTEPSLTYAVPELSDSLEVLEKVQLLETRYLDYKEGAYDPETEPTIQHDALIFYAEALYNYTNRVAPDSWDNQSIDFTHVQEATYNIEYVSSAEEALISENGLFALIDDLLEFDAFSVAPVSDIEITEGDGSILTIKAKRYAIESSTPCIFDPIAPGENYKAVPFEDCAGNTTNTRAAFQIIDATGINCQGTYQVGWVYDVKYITIADRYLASLGRWPLNSSWDYVPMIVTWDPNGSQPLKYGSQSNHSNKFWGGVECTQASSNWRNPNECLYEADLTFWKDQAQSVLNIETAAIGHIVEAVMFPSTQYSNVGPRHYMVIIAGKRGAPANTN